MTGAVVHSWLHAVVSPAKPMVGRSVRRHMTAPAIASARQLDPALSARLRFWSLMAMVLLVYVHAFNLHPRYLEPMTLVDEAASWDTVLQYLIANGLVRFRIPILFAISGYLFAWRDDGTTSHRTRLAKRARTLGIPYLAWGAIALLFISALEQWMPTRELVRAAQLSPFGDGSPFVSNYTAGQLLQRWLIIPAAFQLWFLRSLLMLSALYPWLRIAVQRWPRTFFTIAVLFWLPDGNLFLIEGQGLLFFSLGVWLAARNVNVYAAPAWFNAPLLLALWLTVCAVKTWMAFSIDSLSTPVALTMLLLHRAGEIAGLLTAWFGLDRIVRGAMASAGFRWLTGFSFIIYALHVPMVNFATEAALRAGAGIPHIAFWTYLFVPIAVCATCVAVGVTLRSVARPVYATLTGGRGL
jgi:fucose 4-O-acetylase-like acetyltransferase